ncbi:MAG: iron-siderophore ABC transporter substrate-binding protein [Rubrobacter sp.]|nr:iron-siderophore ABC transporter substrate-binding protein [Rubrobacter sp.]
MKRKALPNIENPLVGILASIPARLWHLDPHPLTIEDITRRDFLVRAGGLFLLAPYGCGGEESGEDASSGETRIVEHALGETEVPVGPERIIDLDGLATDTLLALGIQPAGVPSPESLPPYVRNRLEETRSIGSTEEPDLESLAALEPDLILARQSDAEPVYDELSQIAPTVAAVYENEEDWKEAHLKFSEALGEAGEGERILSDYELRTRELGEAIGGGDEVSIVRPRPDTLRLYSGASFAGTVVRDAGFSVAPVPGLEEGEVLLDISRERLGLADADAVFVWAYEGTPEDEEAAINDLLEDPLFQRLGAVQRGEVHEVGKHWLGLGPLAASLILDDIEEHFLGESS